MEKEITFQVDGLDAGSGTMFIVDGKVDTSDVEETFYKVLRRESANPADEELSHIIDKLTSEQEDKLKAACMEDYHGDKEHWEDAYERFIEDLSLAEIKKIIYGR